MNTTIRIAIDLDGILTEHPRPLAEAANQAFKLSLPDHAFVDSTEFDIPLEVRLWAYGVDGPASTVAPAIGAQALLTTLLEVFGKDRVHIVTARPEGSRAATLAWLQRHGFPGCQILFADDKVAVARRLGITHAIEDSPRHARAYGAAGVECLLVTGDAAPDAVPPEIVCVPDLAAAERHLLDSRAARPRRHRIVVGDVIDAGARETLAREADVVDVDGTNLPALQAALQHADALIVRSETQVTEDVLAAGPRLRAVARAGVGVDNIDVPRATEAGILVLNAPGANAVSAGEHTIALLLAIARAIPEANTSTHAGRWERKRFRPFDLRGKTIGIVGLGRVGSVVAQRLRAFEMRLIGYDPYVTRERFTQLGVEPVSYETLLATADIVSFHVPATEKTTQMLDATAIRQLKQGAIVLNCARGEVVDQHALADALRSGHVAAAGVDVFPHEPAREGPLFGLPNVVLTPHIGGSSREAQAAVGEIISTTTLAALRGEAVPNAVNLPPASLNAPDLQRLTHVAGAAGHLLAVLQSRRPSTIRVTVHGIVPADVVEHVTAAALSAALQRWTNRRVTPVNARLVAQELDLTVMTAVGDGSPERMPEFAFEVDGDPPHHVTVRWDRTDAGILEVDRFSLERPLAGDLLITHHHDRPGIVGRIGMILGTYDVNIAGMQVGRHHRGGEAIMVLNVDDAIPQPALDEIMAIPDVETAYVVSLPAPLPAELPVSPGFSHAAR